MAVDLERIRHSTQAPAPTETKPIAYAHDPIYEQAQNSINQGLARITAGRNTSLQRLTEDFDINKRQAGQQNERNLDALQNKLSNQGINWSGINIQEQGKLGQNFQDTIAALTQGKKRGEEDIATDFAERQAGYEDMRAQAEIGRSERQTAREEERAAAEAQALAAKAQADQQRQWMADLSARLTSLSQPQPQPTGQMNLPPPPQQIIQQAIQQVPPPAAKTPQQQLADIGVNPRDLQQLLAMRGFQPGPIDGIMGRKTQLALAQWKQSVGMPATADITPEIFEQLKSAGVGNLGARSVATSGPAKRAF